jgi:superfamily II DNA or RNA helicase
VVRAVKVGRKVMIVSERLEHLRDLARDISSILFNLDLPFVPVLDFYTGEWFVDEDKKKKRTREELKKAESANVILCTKQMVAEAFDVQALDVIVLATPMSDVEQAIGRVRRWCLPSPGKCRRLCPWRAGQCEGKPTPIVVDVVDERIPILKAKARRRDQFYKSLGSG